MKTNKNELEFDLDKLNLTKPVFSDNSIKVMEKRHLLKNEAGEIIESPQDMFIRVAKSVALKDAKYVKGSNARKQRVVSRTAKEFYDLMANNLFLPGSRVLYEAGNNIDGTGQLSSCFVLPLEDSLESIFETMKEAAIVQKNNGGTGFNFSSIRPKGDMVGGTPNVAAGPIHFIKSFSQAFDQVLQGKKRGGGNMAILNVNHPDIIDFINLKGKDSQVRNFNISVGITDEFMEAVKNDSEYDLINPRNGEVTKTLRAKDVFELICKSAWECADPGLFFLDTAQNANPTKPLGIIEATNPCGEEPLRAYESCNLGSIVLPSYLKQSQGSWDIDWEMLKNSVHSAIHFLDNMIDLSKFPLQKIKLEVEKTRKLGLGVVGLASMLYKMELPYNSQKAIALTSKIMEFIQTEAETESIRLAKERGVFPGFKGSKWDEQNKNVRNATMTAVAPTGTLSLVADTSSGIEPVFALVYRRNSFYQDENKQNKESLLYVDKYFENYAKENGFYSKKLLEKIADNKGSLKNIDEVPKKAKEIFITTHDISPESHIKMQAVTQKFIDAAVSKTINLPETATVNEVKKAYIQAWEQKCKGITTYRDGSKQFQVLENTSSKSEKENKDYDASLDFKLTNNAITVLEKRALKQNKDGEIIETPEELWMRIAKKIASAEDPSNRSEVAKKYFNLMKNGEFYSGGTLLWAGMGEKTILSKCLVLPIEDSIDSIFKTLNWNIQCLRRGVGTGFNFSSIRSTYSKVSTTGEYAAGPLEYLKMYNRAQDTIKGRGGRGLGSMAILNVDHPNIEEFITIKDDYQAMSHYNISVGITNKFMDAVKNDQEWKLIDPKDNQVKKTVNARDLFEKIAKHAWVSGDPGLYFIDTAEETNTTPSIGKMNATNPCGEQPLIPFETCNLGHINLSVMVAGFPYAGDEKVKDWSLNEKLNLINWDRLAEVTKTAIRFLDNIIDINNYPIPEIKEMTLKTRNIGLGIMGFADLLIKLGVTYGSDESIKLADKVMSFVRQEAHKSSVELGKEKGNFPAFKDSVWFKKDYKYMRNTRVTTIAPTGTISIVANVNPGIEPIFALGYLRKNSMGGTNQEVIDPLFETVAIARGFYSEELKAKLAEGKSLSEISQDIQIPQDVIDVFKTSHEVLPVDQIKIQAVFQKNVDSAVSKTVNLPNNSTWQDIAKVYQTAYDTKCKGVTVFRDGSKDPALQVGTKTKEPETNTQITRNTLKPRSREEIVHGQTYKINTEQGELFVTINEDDQGIFEVFLNIGKSGSYTASYTEAVGRLVSTSLRSGIKPEVIISQLQGIRTSSSTMNKGGLIVYSIPDAVAKIMKKHLEEQHKQISLLPSVVQNPIPQVQESNTLLPKDSETLQTEGFVSDNITFTQDESSKYTNENKMGDLLECPDCGSDLEYSEGCILCRSCGYSKCG